MPDRRRQKRPRLASPRLTRPPGSNSPGSAARPADGRGDRKVALLDRLDTTDIVFDGSKPVGDIPPDPTIGPSKSVGDIPPEPTLATTPLVIEFDEPARLDPKRTALAWLIPSPVRQKMLMRWSLGALALHLLPVAMIVSWPVTAEEVPIIPVQLVIVESPPESAPAPAQ